MIGITPESAGSTLIKCILLPSKHPEKRPIQRQGGSMGPTLRGCVCNTRRISFNRTVGEKGFLRTFTKKGLPEMAALVLFFQFQQS
jgi:hypothetical protein